MASQNLVVDNVRLDVNIDHLGEDIEIKDVKYFCKENAACLEDKALALMILRCSPGESSKQMTQQAKKPRFSYSIGKPYHRWFLCADLANPPHCFVIITESLSQTNRLLIHNLDDTYLGKCFYLVEPNITGGKMGHYLNLIHCDDSELIPFKWNSQLLSTTSTIQLPPTSEETFYFAENSKKISVHRARAPTDPSCTGIQCDRQRKKGECLCLNLTPGVPLVYTFDVEFEVDPKMFKSVTHVSNFRSFRTTTVFFRNFIEYSSATTYDRERTVQRSRRKQIRAIVDFVNAHGGWNIVGWCRKGKINIENETEKIDNSVVNLNISYLFPSNPDLFTDQKFLDLQIRSDDSPGQTARTDRDKQNGNPGDEKMSAKRSCKQKPK